MLVLFQAHVLLLNNANSGLVLSIYVLHQYLQWKLNSLINHRVKKESDPYSAIWQAASNGLEGSDNVVRLHYRI